MINFPDAPAVNDVFQDWKWDGSAWGKVPALAEPAGATGFAPWALRNGLWVPTVDKQIIDLSNITTADVKLRHISSTMTSIVRITTVTYGLSQLQLIWSTNGTTWPSVTDSYRYCGFYHASTTGYWNMVATGSTAVPMHYGISGSALNPCISEFWFDRIRGTGHVKAVSEGTSSVVYHMLIRCWSYLQAAAPQYLRLFSHDGVAFHPGSYAIVEEIFQ